MRNWFILMTMAFMFGSCGGEELQTVKQVDLDRYMGKWYEIVRLPNSFEEGLKCITAEYRLKENGKVEVRNAGTDIENGRRESSIGEAKVPDPNNAPGQLKVSFFKPFYGDYFIIELDEEYRWSLVGSPNRKYLWILSREPVLPKDIASRLMSRAEELGFELEGLIWTEQSCDI